MSSATRMIGPWRGGMLIVCLVAALALDARCGGEAAHASPETSVIAADLVLTVHDGLLSLKAQDASLKALFEAIGHQLSIEVVARIPADERITLAFAQLSLAEALKRFRPYVNYLVIEDAGKAPHTIRTLIVVSKRTGGAPLRADGQAAERPPTRERHPREAPATAAPARAAPFSFEFDPTAVRERGR